MKFNKGDIAILPHRDGARLFKVFSHGMTGRGSSISPSGCRTTKTTAEKTTRPSLSTNSNKEHTMQELRKVESSNIEAMGYTGTGLRVKFLSGATYDYPGVPESVVTEMFEAKSQGKFLNRVIKPLFEFKKVA